MKRQLILLVTVIMYLFTLESIAQVNQNFTLVNKTGLNIHKLFVAPVTDSESWGPNLLGSNPLKNGESIEIIFDKGRFPDDCVWDLKINNKDGASLSWFDINLCKYSTITLYWNADKDEGHVTLE